MCVVVYDTKGHAATMYEVLSDKLIQECLGGVWVYLLTCGFHDGVPENLAVDFVHMHYYCA